VDSIAIRQEQDRNTKATSQSRTGTDNTDGRHQNRPRNTRRKSQEAKSTEVSKEHASNTPGYEQDATHGKKEISNKNISNSEMFRSDRMKAGGSQESWLNPPPRHSGGRVERMYTSGSNTESES
jgi:hypothetical protein